MVAIKTSNPTPEWPFPERAQIQGKLISSFP